MLGMLGFQRAAMRSTWCCGASCHPGDDDTGNSPQRWAASLRVGSLAGWLLPGSGRGNAKAGQGGGVFALVCWARTEEVFWRTREGAETQNVVD